MKVPFLLHFVCVCLVHSLIFAEITLRVKWNFEEVFLDVKYLVELVKLGLGSRFLSA